MLSASDPLLPPDISAYPGIQSSNPFSSNSFIPAISDAFQQQDPNSPDAFKQSLVLISGQVTSLQALAQTALSGIRNGYHPGSIPSHTETNITTLKRNIQMIVEEMRQSGVGSLPIISFPTDPSAPPDEERLADQLSESVKKLFEQLRHKQAGAQSVVNILKSSENPRSR